MALWSPEGTVLFWETFGIFFLARCIYMINTKSVGDRSHIAELEKTLEARICWNKIDTVSQSVSGKGGNKFIIANMLHTIKTQIMIGNDSRMFTIPGNINRYTTVFSVDFFLQLITFSFKYWQLLWNSKCAALKFYTF